MKTYRIGFYDVSNDVVGRICDYLIPLFEDGRFEEVSLTPLEPQFGGDCIDLTFRDTKEEQLNDPVLQWLKRNNEVSYILIKKDDTMFITMMAR